MAPRTDRVRLLNHDGMLSPGEPAYVTPLSSIRHMVGKPTSGFEHLPCKVISKLHRPVVQMRDKQKETHEDENNPILVRLSHLPRQMRCNAMVEAMMEQAGLEKVLQRCDVASHDSVLLYFADRKAAEACVRHCNGRLWGGTAIVAAIDASSVAPTSRHGKSAMDAAKPAAVPRRRTASEETTATSSDQLPPPPGFASEEESVAVVCLTNLPNAMRSASMIQAMLEQADIAEDILSCHNNDQGEVYVEFANMKAAESCIQHCNGRSWGGSGVKPVYARLYSTTRFTRPAKKAWAVAAKTSSSAASTASVSARQSPTLRYHVPPGAVPVQKQFKNSYATAEDGSTEDGSSGSEASA
eukprot:TRINITY_DN64432_c0_g1_i1.p1 TRINITY_DN64432_c0_g1~~TRINITY_DN64432_c0_g1_i1.p1  ORF type:complete len:355 (-),score=42.81 TRINITY_DN64432_c0_g1_i1:351-1415(-)